MEYDLKLCCTFFLGAIIIFKTTKHNYMLENRLTLLENNLTNLKERTADLELFKLKCYSNEITVGRRAWDDNNLDVDYEFDEDLD